MRLVGCQCQEGQAVVDGELVQIPGHDCAYVAQRNSLIPEASRLASLDFSEATKPGSWSGRFHYHMDRLARERGVVR